MKAMNSDPNKRYASADAMIEDLEKFRRDPSVDMDYIRQELTAPAADTEPTMPLPTAQVASAVKKHTGELRREREAEEEPPRRDKKSIAIICRDLCRGGAAGGAAVQADTGAISALPAATRATLCPISAARLWRRPRRWRA